MRNISWDEVTPEKEVDCMGGGGVKEGAPHLSGYFWKMENFFHKVNGVFSTRKQFFENGLQSGVFFLLRTPLIRHTAKGKGRYGILFVVTVFAWKGKNTCVLYTYFFENGERNLRFQKYLDTCGHGRGLTFILPFIYYPQLP